MADFAGYHALQQVAFGSNSRSHSLPPFSGVAQRRPRQRRSRRWGARSGGGTRACTPSCQRTWTGCWPCCWSTWVRGEPSRFPHTSIATPLVWAPVMFMSGAHASSEAHAAVDTAHPAPTTLSHQNTHWAPPLTLSLEAGDAVDNSRCFVRARRAPLPCAVTARMK